MEGAHALDGYPAHGGRGSIVAPRSAVRCATAPPLRTEHRSLVVPGLRSTCCRGQPRRGRDDEREDRVRTRRHVPDPGTTAGRTRGRVGAGGGPRRDRGPGVPDPPGHDGACEGLHSAGGLRRGPRERAQPGRDRDVFLDGGAEPLRRPGSGGRSSPCRRPSSTSCTRSSEHRRGTNAKGHPEGRPFCVRTSARSRGCGSAAAGLLRACR